MRLSHERSRLKMCYFLNFMENTLPTTHYFFTLPIKKRITHRDLLPTYDSDDEDEDDDDTEGDRFE